MTFMRRRTANAARAAFQKARSASEAVAIILGVPPQEVGEAPHPDDAVTCPKCAKPLKKRGAHLHTRACKGAS